VEKTLKRSKFLLFFAVSVAGCLLTGTAAKAERM